MVQRREANIDEGGVLRRRSRAEALEELDGAGVGDIVLLDGGLDGGDILDLVVEALVASQDGDEVGDLLLRELAVGHERESSGLLSEIVFVALRSMIR